MKYLGCFLSISCAILGICGLGYKLYEVGLFGPKLEYNQGSYSRGRNETDCKILVWDNFNIIYSHYWDASPDKLDSLKSAHIEIAEEWIKNYKK